MLIIVNAVKLLVMCEVDVKGVREKLGYMQKEFAKLVFSSERTVQNWEAGKTIPPCILGVYEKSTHKGTHFGPRGCFFYRFFAPADHSFFGVISRV